MQKLKNEEFTRASCLVQIMGQLSSQLLYHSLALIPVRSMLSRNQTKVLKCQDLPKFNFRGEGEGDLGGYSEQIKTEVLKCQDLPKFQFSGEGRGVFWEPNPRIG